MRQHFNLAAGQARVFSARRARTHKAHHLQAKLVAHAFGRGKGLGAIGVANDLHQTLAVTQVNKNDTTMVTAAMGPAHQGHGLAEQRFAHKAAVSCSHGITPEFRCTNFKRC